MYIMSDYCLKKSHGITLGLVLMLVFLVDSLYGQSEIQQVQINPGESVRLNVHSEGATSYVWLVNNQIIDKANSDFYIANREGVYSAIAYNDFNCASVASNLVEVVFKSSGIRYSIEHFCELSKPTVLDIDIGVADLIWYSDQELEHSLSSETLLQHGTTYYAGSSKTSVVYAVQVFLDQCLDIAVDKQVDRVEAVVGTQVNFTIQVKNTGKVVGENLVIKEQLPDGFKYKDHQLSLGHYSSVSGLWEIPKLDPNAMEELKLRAQVMEGHNYQNTAELIYSEPEDYFTSNNISSASVEPNCVKVFEIFTPNNDGMNDTFVIHCIEQYPNNELKVFDKDGSLVYSKKAYDNNWRGYSNSNWTFNKNELLPSDVYFYVLNLGNDTKPITGWIFITY